MSANLRVAVIGVGHLGQHHARILAAMEGVNLVGVADVRPGRAQEIAAKYGTTPFTDARDLRDRVDAVAAALILQGYLDRTRASRQEGAG